MKLADAPLVAFSHAVLPDQADQSGRGEGPDGHAAVCRHGQPPAHSLLEQGQGTGR